MPIININNTDMHEFEMTILLLVVLVQQYYY